LHELRRDIRLELATNRLGNLDKAHPSLAHKFPDTFPNLEIANLYLNPVTSWSKGIKVEPFDFKPREPDIGKILAFCVERLSWKKDKSLKRLYNNVWEGVANRMLMAVCTTNYSWTS
jgi:Holliday junction resolvase YEN1